MNYFNQYRLIPQLAGIPKEINPEILTTLDLRKKTEDLISKMGWFGGCNPNCICNVDCKCENVCPCVSYNSCTCDTECDGNCLFVKCNDHCSECGNIDGC